MFPPSLSRPTLAVLGICHARGPILPIVEMQARWAVKVFTGKRLLFYVHKLSVPKRQNVSVCCVSSFKGLSRLPPKEKMLEVIESERRRNMKR